MTLPQPVTERLPRDPAKNIYEAISRVMEAVEGVQKTQAANLGYSYAGEASIIAALRPAMVREGLSIHTHQIREHHFDTYSTARGTMMGHAVLVVTFVFAHAPSGDTIYVEATGEGSDAGDKAYNKALTGAFKYALRQTFALETGDDPDLWPSEARGTPPTARTRQSADGGQGQAKAAARKPSERWTEFWSRARKAGFKDAAAVHAFAGVESIKDWDDARLEELLAHMEGHDESEPDEHREEAHDVS